MSLLKPASNQTAYLKAGILGFQGSGKTYTAARIAAGLARLSKSKAPKVAFFDTEKGSDFMVPFFKKEGIEFDVAKSRTFVDLIEFMREVEKEGYDVAIVDSISHVWADLMDSYTKRLRRSNGLLFQDWSKVKGEWRQFTDAFINTKLHTLVLGRAGYNYDFDEDESGKKELIKTGTKMKAEGEFGYESDLLLEMERVPNKGGKGWVNRCIVLKDRTDTMNGSVLDMPKFEDFKTVVAALNIGGEHFGLDTTRDSQDMFQDPDWSYVELKKQRDIALEELQGVLIEHDLGGTSAAAQKGRQELLKEVYDTVSKTYIEGLHPDKIREGVRAIKAKFAKPEQDTGELVTPDQLKRIFATLGSLDIKATEDQKAIIYGLAKVSLQVEITSTKQLTKVQAAKLIDELDKSDPEALKMFFAPKEEVKQEEPF